MFDPESRLPSSGMKVVEAIAKAEAWWDKTGRYLIDKSVNQEERERCMLVALGGPGIVLPGEMVATTPSGILNGLPWHELNAREKLAITRSWHHFYVVQQHVEPEKRSETSKETLNRLEIKGTS